MYLKELTLKGFKSFASATTLRFEPGITAVVGPNGSGKSNIVDALTWVMGEQGARNLRGTSMEDVIFAGTSSKPPLGRAQVSLTIDNTDRTLDIDYTEVTITRTIFRNGGSEYAINGSPCRLLDIQELLSDTGLGSHMHVIVGQGRLDQILRADPSGHRAFIEEAAGILKHRKRKERALRKLAATQTNLSRLDDLLGEIRRQMGPLGRQARVSRRADAIQIALRDAQARLLADDASQIISRRDDIRGRLTKVRGELSGLQREMASVRLRIEQAENASRAASPEISRLTGIWHEMGQIQERLRSLRSLAEERRRSFEEQIATDFGDDPQMLDNRADELAAQARQRERETDELRRELDGIIERRSDTERRLASLQRTGEELRTATRQRESQRASLRERIAREEAMAQAAAIRHDDAIAQRDALASDLAAATDALHTAQAAATESGDDETALAKARHDLSQANVAAGDMENHLRSLDTDIASLQAKAEALADTLASRGSSTVWERNRSLPTLGRLVDFIHVSDGWEDAISHALGDFAGAMVVPDDDGMLAALRQAVDDRMGKAAIVRPDMDADHDGDNRSDDTADAGMIPASALIGANPRAEDEGIAHAVVHAVIMLLDDVAFVHTRQEALDAMARGHHRAVTIRGEVFQQGVAATGGTASSHSDLSLAARRDKAIARAVELQSERERIVGRLDEAQRAVDAAARRVQQEQDALTERRMQAKQAAAAVRAARHDVESLGCAMDAAEQKIMRLVEESKAHLAAVQDLREALQALENTEDVDADIDALAGRERELAASLASVRETELATTMRWKDAGREAASYRRQETLLRDNAERSRRRRTELEASNRRRREQAAQAAGVAAMAAMAAESLSARIAAVETRREELQRESSVHDDELAGLRARRDELEPQVAELQRSEHSLDVDRERLTTRYDELAGRISDALGMTFDEAIAQYGPDRPVPVVDSDGEVTGGMLYVREEQERRLEQARRDLARLGRVNPLATEEFEALQARNKYLNEQRNDVVKSRDDLMTLVDELDRTMIDVFRKAFDDTAKAFERMFAVLFPGGQGSLVLENPDDLLSTGVLVRARPAGKRVRQLSLLSGGERSLTALAFLFAIFEARPSPFYVMDEVEAALDDVNLTRLLNAFDELREHAQLIVITHQQRTMGVADALYGVTMRADGVTAVVSQRMGHSPERIAEGE
ncbi:chromosome segregation protein SMC [Bifidobacterium sp. SMB2]|uniref:Chromosome partition protein Smc n=1 Tax=Bifidobacterium saimiriisciurei TaxID=2661627 RepID=A0ABX0CAB1_9BIFI|nr:MULTISPECIES: chromosome segregation protein SMC [Bifidobacterium]NEG95754.1 chromosome segregation protein SMC [Bifidobacterium sp. SMB2]NEH11181.1 chromosome segregation protein SMC [Bifidobacterium saimiriisciurei]